VLSADFNNGTPVNPLVGYYVLANWGELAIAAVMATIAFLQGAALLAPLLGQHSPTGNESTAGRVSAGVGLAVAAGLATGALYAVTAAVFFNEPISHLMHWALLPTLPTCAAGATLAVLAWRRGAAPVNGWDGFLSFPVSATFTAATGIVAVGLWWQGRLPWWLNGWTTSLGLAGGLLLGAATACTLVRHPAARVALTLPIGLFTTIISHSGPDILAIMWAIAVGCWWAWHAWALARILPAGSVRR
jgi:hypothetical protein